MESLWNNFEMVNLIRLIAQWAVAICGIVALVFTMRSTSLKNMSDTEKAKTDSLERIALYSQVETAKSEATSAKSEVTAAKLELAETKEKLQPRKITEAQLKILHEELKGNSQLGIQSGIPIVIETMMMDKESSGYGNQIYEAINNLGWEVGIWGTSSHIFPGMAIFFNPSTKESKSCKAVQDAFKKAKIDFSTKPLAIRYMGIQVENTVYIVIGHK